MVSRYRHDPAPAAQPKRLYFWTLLDALEKGAREEAGALAEDESCITRAEITREGQAPVPAVVFLTIRSALVGVPSLDAPARWEVYGHNPGREWEHVHNLPMMDPEQVGEVLFAVAASHWHNGGRL